MEFESVIISSPDRFKYDSAAASYIACCEYVPTMPHEPDFFNNSSKSSSGIADFQNTQSLNAELSVKLRMSS
jgi:hypothetical protein